MAAKIALALILVGLLTACSSMRCEEQSQNHRTAGGCGLFSKF